jgi:hypothetical protein
MSRDYQSDELEQPQRPRTIFNALLFPANLVGLAHIGIYTVCFALLAWVESSMILGIARIGVAFIGLIVTIELINYLHHCVRESADGAMSAPDSLLVDSFDVGDVSATLGGYFMLQFQYIAKLIPVLICFLPGFLYPIFTQRFDTIFVLLVAAGAFYCPMFLLAVILFDSSSGYNPFIHIISMIKTFFSYCLLVIETGLIVAGFVWLVYLFQNSILGAIILFPILMYLIMIMMHLLGRFFYLNQHKLNWEV